MTIGYIVRLLRDLLFITFIYLGLSWDISLDLDIEALIQSVEENAGAGDLISGLRRVLNGLLEENVRAHLTKLLDTLNANWDQEQGFLIIVWLKAIVEITGEYSSIPKAAEATRALHAESLIAWATLC